MSRTGLQIHTNNGLKLVASILRTLTSVALSVLMLASTAYAGGPLILAGHDADDHGFTAQYITLFNAVRANVTNGGSGILAIGPDVGSTAGNWITAVAAGMTPPQTVTFINNATISTQSFAGFAMLYVPSTDVDVSGGIGSTGSPSENARLISRFTDIAAFINGGGGLFGLTQDQVANAYDYLGTFANITALGVPASGDCDAGAGNALYDDVTATVLGGTLGITNTNIDGCCWHNVFTSFAPFLEVLATANEPACTIAINTVPSVIGCLQCNIPGQMNLTPTPDLNPVGTNHTVTATFLHGTSPFAPIVGATITFTVISGPNTGVTGTGTSPTNGSGQATFTYTGTGGVGLDVIQATGTDTLPNPDVFVTSNDALKFWDKDCNNNQIPDVCDLSCSAYNNACLANYPGCGTEDDLNVPPNGIPDSCDACVTNADCADALFCNGAEVCNVAVCQAGPPPNCNDNLFCTDDSCNENTNQCDNTAHSCNDGQFCTDDSCNENTNQCDNTAHSCDDGFFCTDDSCDENANECDNTVHSCNDGFFCTDDSCNENTNQCDNTAHSCDDGFFCTDDSCDENANQCDNTAHSCNDGLFCTDDSCNENADQCDNTAHSCNDGQFCTDDSCNEGTNQCDNTAHSCDDTLFCTDDSCNENTNQCDNTAHSCNDGQFCTDDSCNESTDQCDNTTHSCNDGVVCTDDTCNENTNQCVNAPNDGNCNNQLFCDGVETCDAQLGCVDGADPNCSDNVDCTIDACSGNSCSHVPDNNACADPLFCNGDETCDLNGCHPSQIDPCPGVPVCDEAGDQCVNCLTNADCNNTLFCDGVETCVAKVCVDGADPNCDDNVDCTVDMCVESNDTCSHTPDDGLCGDELFCTGAATCNLQNGCQFAATNCDDGVDCTVDTCNEQTNACNNVGNDASCADLLFCNGTEVCVDQGMGQGCGSGTAVVCTNSDGFVCTVETCDEATDACVISANQCVCGNGTPEPGEECDPPSSTEDCNNMADDDGDQDVDCLDQDCQPPAETCGLDCMLDDACQVVQEDPATIMFGQDGEPDRFVVHGRIAMLSPIEPLSEGFGVRLSNAFGTVYEGVLGSGDMRGKLGGRSFKFSDKTARIDGTGVRAGLYRVGVKVRPYDGVVFMTFKLTAYGDFSAATEAEMTTEVVVGSNVGYLEAVWTKTARGWKLPLSDFEP